MKRLLTRYAKSRVGFIVISLLAGVSLAVVALAAGGLPATLAALGAPVAAVAPPFVRGDSPAAEPQEAAELAGVQALAATLNVCPSGCPYNSVRAAINAAANGDTINVGAGTYTEAGIVVNKSLTIQGQDPANTIVQAATSQGVAGDRVFWVQGGVVTFQGLTIRHGKAEWIGGGVRIESAATVTIINCAIVNNTVTGGTGATGATGYTGATGATGAAGIDADCTGGCSRDSTSGGQGGLGGAGGTGGAGGNSHGGGIYSVGSLTILDSTLSGNQAIGGTGGTGGRGGTGGTGGIGGRGGNGAYGIDARMRSICKPGRDGGAGGTGGTGGTGGAGGGGYGGALYTDGALTLTRATIRDNTEVKGGNGGSGGPGGAGGSGGAGGPAGGSSNYWCPAPTYQGPSGLSGGGGAAGGNGGGGVGWCGGLCSTNTANVTNSTIQGNRADTVGGGIVSSGTLLAVSYSTISDNASPGVGNGIYMSGGTTTVKGTIVYGNGSSECVGSIGSEGYNLSGDASCGFTGTGDLQSTDPQLGPLQNNGGPTDTRALPASSPAIGKIPAGAAGCGVAPLNQDQRGQIRPRNGFCDMGAVQSGSPMVTTTDDESGENRSKCSLREAITAANTDAAFGGCFGGMGADTISVPAGLYRLTRAGAGEDNNATGDLDITAPLILTGVGQTRTFIDANGLDRAFHILGGSVTINNMTVRNGRADNGGGINVAAAVALTVSNSILSGNAATNQGGGIFAAGALIVNNSTLSGNTATADGGGLHVRNSTATISGSTFSGNTTQASGGAIFNTNSTATVGSSTIFSNTAQVNGGGIYSSSAVTVTASTLDSNRTGNWGGGIFVNDGAANIISSTVSGNTAANQGGGIYINNGATAIGVSAIFSNTAATAGGGIFVNNGATNVSNSTVSNNTAGQGGGARVAGGRLILLFTTLAWNATTGNQGAHLSNSGAITLTATALAEAQGGVSCAGTAPASGGYNRISDTSCLITTGSDIADATILLQPLADNRGPTQTHLPNMVAGNQILSIVPTALCEQWLGVNPADQRGVARPQQVIGARMCDAGSVELTNMTRFVCGPPLSAATTPARCQYPTIAAALVDAMDNDTIVVSGVVVETVTVNRNLTIRGPSADESTLGTHLGVIQAAAAPPASAGAPIFTIPAGKQVTLQDLNIRYGYANSGVINNAGVLTVQGVTLYANNSGAAGSLILNNMTGRLTLINSTLTGNLGTGPLIRNAANATGAVRIQFTTLAGAGSTLLRNDAVLAAAMNVSDTILTGTAANQCNNVTSGGGNLHRDCLVSPAVGDRVGDPLLGVLRDNGGPTLTRALGAGSPANGGSTCGVTRDQRGRSRPATVCATGAVEAVAQTLTVCAGCDADPAHQRYNDLQLALQQAMAGDTIALEAGAYTGNFTIYKDVTLQHAGLDVSGLSRERPVDVQAILQASDQTFTEQHRLQRYAGTVLTVQGYALSDASIVPSNDVAVTLRGLTIRNGASQRGGGIYNLGTLNIFTSTVEGNVAYNGGVTAMGGGIYNAGQLKLERSTVSGNQSEYYGGAIYNAGPPTQAGGATTEADITASTFAENRASRLPDQKVVAVTDAGMSPTTLTIQSGDEIRFENRTANAHTLNVTVGAGGTCQPSRVTVPAMGTGLSDALICTRSGATGATPVAVTDSQNGSITLQVTVQAVASTPVAHIFYRTGVSQVNIARSILFSSAGAGQNCDRPVNDIYAVIATGGYNLVSDTSCIADLRASDRQVDQTEVSRLGPLQDNNTIDFTANRISGYTYAHALAPNSAAIDRIPPQECGVAAVRSVELQAPFSGLSLTMDAGGIVQWRNRQPYAVTLAFHDGESAVQLVQVPAADGSNAGLSRQVQFTTAGDQPYTIYHATTRAVLGRGTVSVLSVARLSDQRGIAVPQRGAASVYACDIGAYEFAPWVVGQPLPRPPAAIGTQPPGWAVAGASVEDQAYHAWSSATSQDFALRPSRAGLAVTVNWNRSMDPTTTLDLYQAGVVEWPDAPQIHVSGALVNLSSSQITDGYLVSGARAFEGTEPADDRVGAILSQAVFTRTALSGDSYSVLEFGKGSQSNVTFKALVVKTVDWNTAGVRDMTPERAACTIGSTLSYPLHDDPEGKAGYILSGNAYDGVRTAAEQSVTANTVGNLISPSHVRETRNGPIIPILATAPTAFTNSDPAAGGHDLRVAWYRPDGRNVAWPVRTVGYRCDWPIDAPQIVIASELGSEIGGQPVLGSDRFVNSSIYHQPDAGQPGFSLNYEHALLAASNLGNTAPAFYALRTDLFDRDNTAANRSFALLKYQDPAENNQPKIAVYQVLLTRAAQPIPTTTVTPRAGSGDLPAGDQFTVPVELLGAQALRTATVQVTYAPALLTPVTCAVNRQDWQERPVNLTLASDAPARPGDVMHLRASLVAGTDVSYQWNFGDGQVQIDQASVSHVYGAAGVYTVIVTATNSLFDQVLVASTPITVALGAVPVPLPAASPTGCRIGPDGVLTLEVVSHNKHGRSGDQTLADVTFTRLGTNQSSLTPQVISLAGPAYESLSFDVAAGNPVYAPVPMQSLLDVQQPCTRTQAADLTALPFWKDYRDKLWARAAGDMQVLYFYPLQASFSLSPAQAAELGLPAAAADQVGKCVPWLHKLAAGTLPYPDFPEAGRSTQVLPVAYHVSWPALSPLLSVGETVYERAKSGVSAVATQAAVTRIYDDLAPGVWNTGQKKIVLQGNQVIQSLAQLIAPTDEVRTSLPIKINGNYSLPEEIKTERRLYGGGLAIVGNKNDINLNLPFSLRSRISYDDTAGQLVFSGYYDGASPEYIKGDPLLLLNVMSSSDLARLQALCPGAGANCVKYKDALKSLYWKTLNPRGLDLCRDANGRLLSGDPEPAANQLAKTSAMKACDTTYYRDGQPDQAFLIGVQDADNNGTPEPYDGLGKGKALTAGNAAGTGYVTLAYNNDESLGGLPVSLQVIKVGCEKNAQGDDSTYRGNLLVIKSDNLFDEKLTLRHTGDFGGRPDKFTFDWYIAGVDDTGVSPAVAPPAYPWRQWTKIEPGMTKVGAEITVEGANPTTLSDNWLIARYKGYAVCGNAYRYSAFAGDPSAKPSEVKAQLAEGWIKRVTSALNPFDARVTDFVSSPVNTTVSMIQQAGPRYEGPVAMSSDPATLNKMGLIEAYQTVLERGRALSIDSNINDQGANAALLNVTSRIADLYMLLANDAYADALDPTVGLGTTSSLGSRAGSAFAFMNQFPATQFGPIDEELALLRGRDQTLGGVAAGPTYNRLTWNFTHGNGAVAYQQNYNVKDVNGDGFINEADAAIMYPQGHGDAWGQFLTASTKYYELLRHPNYTWVPRAEPVSVAGAPVVVDYYDERRFAINAANKARIGAEIVDLTYRKHYADPASQPYRDTHVDATDTCVQQAPADCQQRAWGVADWAERAGEGALFDWVVANAILPAVDDRYTDLRKIDRTTVAEIGQIAEQYAAIQNKLDTADKRANPLGLAPNALLFDLDPARTKTTPSQDGQTHFEQVYERATASLGNAVALFDYANEMKVALRDSQNSQHDFAQQVTNEDRSLVNELIDLFGTPYSDDIGVNGTYPAGYEGPDIYNYDLTDRTTMTDFQKRCTRDQITSGRCSSETRTYTVQYQALDCIGNYVTYTTLNDVQNKNVCRDKIVAPVGIEYTVGTGLDAGYGRFTPATWSGSRRVSGLIPNSLGAVYAARANYELAVTQYQNLVDAAVQAEEGIQDRVKLLKKERGRQVGYTAAAAVVKSVALVLKEVALGMQQGDKQARAFSTAASECLPTVVGMAADATSAGRCSLLFAGSVVAAIMEPVQIAATVAADAAEFGLTVSESAIQLANLVDEQDYELRQMGREFQDLLRQEKELRIQVLLAQDELGGAQSDYLNAVQLGFRKLKELSVKRQQWAGQISEQRYGDMAYRTFQIDALQKYRQQFDMAQLYTFLAAGAYDYETNLAGSDPANGDHFVRQIANLRSLGDVRVAPDATVVPIAGSRGLADPLARMSANIAVLKGQMGFNNPQSEANRFSLRSELFRFRDTSDAKWRQELQRYYTSDIYSNDAVARLAKRPYGETGPQPGLVIPFGTVIRDRLNFFGLPLGPGDSAYDASQFATKIASVGIWFDGYDTARLAQTPRVYLLPAGKDVIRPRNASGQLRYWNLVEQLLPVPYPITQDDMQDPDWIARVNGLNGQLFASKPYARLRAYPYSDDLSPDELNTDTRLIGRSVWNTQWLLVIPGTTLLADPRVGIERFMQDVDDIYLYFQTYAYAGTAAAQAEAKAQAKVEAKAKTASTSTLTSASAQPLPLPDVLFYGTTARNNELLTAGTVKAILPRGAVVNVTVTPITGTNYTYALSVPLGQYDPDLGAYAADSARPGETIRFLVNDAPAAFRDANGATTDQFIIPANGSGRPNRLDLKLVGPDSYPLGDVNANGVRNSADALLVLKYDVGLITGDTNFPPAPGKIYLPLCNIVPDGKCNSSDALRILQCEVQLPGVNCPDRPTVTAAPDSQPSQDPLAPAFRVEISRTASANQVLVRVRGGDSRGALAAAAVDLGYAADRLKLESCVPTSAGLDGGYCNATYGPGLARLAVIAAAGVRPDQVLAELAFRLPAAASPLSDADLLAAFAPRVRGAYDGAGEALGWRLLGTTIGQQPAGRSRIYLPLVFQTATMGR